MNIVKSIYPSTSEYMEKLNKACQKALQLCPEEFLRVNKVRGQYFFRVYNSSEKRRSYMSKDDPRFLTLVKKYCAARIISALQRTNWLSNIPNEKAFAELDKINTWLEDRFADACPSFVQSRRTLLREWQEKSYSRNPMEIDINRCPQTERGEYVRSKTENFIADYFYKNNIPYKLEYPVDVGTRTLYPDFVFVNPSNGNVYYLEAFGIMDDPEYVRNSFMRKIRDYARIGLVFGENFFATFESAEFPFDHTGFRHMIESILAR